MVARLGLPMDSQDRKADPTDQEPKDRAELVSRDIHRRLVVCLGTGTSDLSATAKSDLLDAESDFQESSDRQDESGCPVELGCLVVLVRLAPSAVCRPEA